MPIPSYNFGLTIRYPVGHAQQGQPYSGCTNVQLKCGEVVVDLNEVGNSAFYFASGVPAGRWMLWVNSISSGQSFGVGEGELAGLGYDNGKTLQSESNRIGWAPPAATIWATIVGKPDAFPPSLHSHAQGDISGLSLVLAGKADVGDVPSESEKTAWNSKLYGSVSTNRIPQGDTTANKLKDTGWEAYVNDMQPVTDNASNLGNLLKRVKTVLAYTVNSATEIIEGGVTLASKYAAIAHTQAISTITGLGSALDGLSATIAEKEPLHSRTDINSSTDWDTLVYEADLRQTGGVIGPNGPAGAYGYGRLKIFSKSLTQVAQLYLPFRNPGAYNGGIYLRVMYSGTWAGWQHLIDLAALQAVGLTWSAVHTFAMSPIINSTSYGSENGTLHRVVERGLAVTENGIRRLFSTVLFTGVTAKVINNTTTEGTFSTVAAFGSAELPQYFWQAGIRLKVRAYIKCTSVTSASAVYLKFTIGGITIVTLTTPSIAYSNTVYSVELEIVPLKSPTTDCPMLYTTHGAGGEDSWAGSQGSILLDTASALSVRVTAKCASATINISGYMTSIEAIG